MKISYVDKIPAAKRRCKLQPIIFAFAESDKKIMKIEFDEGKYKDIHSMINSWCMAVSKTKCKNIKVHGRAPMTLYLEKVVDPDDDGDVYDDEDDDGDVYDDEDDLVLHVEVE